jgi:preprotein translocase subunit Sec61beta
MIMTRRRGGAEGAPGMGVEDDLENSFFNMASAAGRNQQMLRHWTRGQTARAEVLAAPLQRHTICFFNSIADEHGSQRESRRRPRCPGLLPASNQEEINMKAIFIEPFLIVASSLLWILVLPFAALFCSGVAISHRVAVA